MSLITVSSPTVKWQLAMPVPDITSQLFLRKTAPVIVVDPVPTLRISVGTEFGVAAILIAKPFGPTLRVAQRHDLGTRWVATLCTRNPSFARLSPAISRPEPALLLPLLRAPHPPLALGQGQADLGTGLNLHCHKLVRAHTVIQEAPNGGTIALQIREQCLPSIPDHGVLLLACRPLECCSTDQARSSHGGKPACTDGCGEATR
mmetsp:Transcript_40334/g.79670  ORF Transcript_40334/g.79670 Transcript_40334/m.79670 type:complete len:204 (+) Transcript_40334:187-798(+)